jgi:hypothetical protein
MYCSSCGVAVVEDLSYCKRCGAKLGGAQADGVKSTVLSPTSLVWAMVSVFIIGLGAIIALLAVMKGTDPFNEAMIKAFAVLSFLLMLAAEGVFTWLLLGRKEATKASGPTQLKAETTGELGAAERMLPEPVTSVTEHTTRTMGPLYSERESSEVA